MDLKQEIKLSDLFGRKGGSDEKKPKKSAAKTRAAASIISGARRLGLGRERRVGSGTTVMARILHGEPARLGDCVVPRRRAKFYLLGYR